MARRGSRRPPRKRSKHVHRQPRADNIQRQTRAEKMYRRDVEIENYDWWHRNPPPPH